MAYAIGITWQEFWNVNPHIIKLIAKGHAEKLKEQDSIMHMMGIYVMSAVSVSIDRFAAGKNSKAKYIKEPILQKSIEEQCMTQEELDERELQKMLMYEEQWANMGKLKGLPTPELK